MNIDNVTVAINTNEPMEWSYMGTTIKVDSRGLFCFNYNGASYAYPALYDAEQGINSLKGESYLDEDGNYTIGSVIPLGKVKVQVVAQSGCCGCFFARQNCCSVKYLVGDCAGMARLDGKCVIFKEVK